MVYDFGQLQNLVGKNTKQPALLALDGSIPTRKLVQHQKFRKNEKYPKVSKSMDQIDTMCPIIIDKIDKAVFDIL